MYLQFFLFEALILTILRVLKKYDVFAIIIRFKSRWKFSTPIDSDIQQTHLSNNNVPWDILKRIIVVNNPSCTCNINIING